MKTEVKSRRQKLSKGQYLILARLKSQMDHPYDSSYLSVSDLHEKIHRWETGVTRQSVRCTIARLERSRLVSGVPVRGSNSKMYIITPVGSLALRLGDYNVR